MSRGAIEGLISSVLVSSGSVQKSEVILTLVALNEIDQFALKGEEKKTA